MTTVLALQRRLLSLGYNPGTADGLIGRKTLTAMNQALSDLDILGKASAEIVMPEIIADDWMPWAQMTRIILHWTAGHHIASTTDKKHYHLLIEGNGKLVRGIPSIDLNQGPLRAGYAAHTLNCNRGSIGVSLCAMAGAVERPFQAGSAPVTQQQWDAAIKAVAALCRRYAIPVTKTTVLTHAEVQVTLGILQRGKWDVAILPFKPSLNTPAKVGDAFRLAVAAAL